ATDGATAKNVVLKPIAETQNPIQTGTLELARFEPKRYNRALLGYKVYRDGAQIAQINDPAITTYTDWDLNNGEYLYGVSCVYSDGESAPAMLLVDVDFQLAPIIFSDSFETYADFVTEIAPWTLLDQDNSETYGFQGIQFPNSGAPMAYIVFNPTTTVPPIENLTAYDGTKMMASFAAVSPPNNDWLITPRTQLSTNSALRFYARSHTTQYGMERFRVGVSTLSTIIPQGFQYVSGPDYVEVPGTWTEYVYDLSNYDNQNVYVAIRCVSNDAFILFVDQVSLHSGPNSNEDQNAPAVANELKGNYPNPFNPETTISYSMVNAGPVNIDIYNQKGQLVKNLVNGNATAGNHTIVWNGTDNNGKNVSSGIYYYKMNAGKYSSTKKMIMMK
ncbi:MAG: choice-of-anchor J domain-containing protein, partial [Candidatus Cloacimonetes bacterium]|nr:choice-of-anchor J domain-containing protein [Candidatus Cloacimonadota bacterium]